MSYREDGARYREMTASALEKYLQNPQIPQRLLTAMAYSVHNGGKRLRPCLTLASCEMLEGDLAAALPVACALEMIHTYSLIHDDLPAMDNDDFRRGKPSNHKVYGEGMAILAGDGLLSYAFEIMLEALGRYSGNPGYLKAIQAVAGGAGVCGMVAGQAVDLESEGDLSGGAERLRYTHARKTGAIIKAAVLSGAYIAGARAEQVDAIGEFGSLYGLLFQITDDILDVEGSFAGMGKTLGKDKDANKLTYVNLFGLEASKTMARETAEKAKAALKIFQSRAAFLEELTDYTLERKH